MWTLVDPHGVTSVHKLRTVCVMESAPSATNHARAYEQMYALAQAISVYDGIAANLREDHVEVFRLTPGGTRMTITCKPRADDGGRLWFWNSRREPIGPAGHPDTPMQIVRELP